MSESRGTDPNRGCAGTAPNVRSGGATQRKRRRLIGIPAAIVFLGVMIFAVIPPLVMHRMVNSPVTFAQTWTGADQGLVPERLVLTTQDGLDIVAYEVYVAHPKAVVIFLSGIHNPSVTAFFGHARMLLDEGYASILLEMRAHGESDGDRIALGFEEYRDTRAAVDYIRTNSRYMETPIVVYGLSMGGAVAINSIGQIPDIAALISMSAYSAWDDLFLDNMGAPELVAAVQRPFVRLYTAILYGWSSRGINPKDEIQKLGVRPALLIHARGDSQIPYSNFERLVANAPPHVETWVRASDSHFIVNDGLFLTPSEDLEYSVRILGFLNRHFDAGSAGHSSSTPGRE